MQLEELSTEEKVAIARDMMMNPGKYGLSEAFIREWKMNNISQASDTVGRISGNLRDELADAAINTYRELKKMEEEK